MAIDLPSRHYDSVVTSKMKINSEVQNSGWLLDPSQELAEAVAVQDEIHRWPLEWGVLGELVHSSEQSAELIFGASRRSDIRTSWPVCEDFRVRLELEWHLPVLPDRRRSLQRVSATLQVETSCCGMLPGTKIVGVSALTQLNDPMHRMPLIATSCAERVSWDSSVTARPVASTNRSVRLSKAPIARSLRPSVIGRAGSDER